MSEGDIAGMGSDTAGAETPNLNQLALPLNTALHQQNLEETAKIMEHLIGLGSRISDVKDAMNTIRSDVRITQMTVNQIQSDTNSLKTTVTRI